MPTSLERVLTALHRGTPDRGPAQTAVGPEGIEDPRPSFRMALRDTLPRGGSIQGQAGNCLPRTGCLLDSALSAWGGVGPDGFHPEPAVAARPGRDRHRVQLG